MTVLSEQKGRRVPDGEWFEFRDRGELRPGDYGLVTGEEEQTEDVQRSIYWHARWFEACEQLEQARTRLRTLLDASRAWLVSGRYSPNEDWAVARDWLETPRPSRVPEPELSAESDPRTGWLARCPNGVDVNLSRCHPVTVQEDGTVSVSGSIVAGDWHGWLCRGVWRLA